MTAQIPDLIQCGDALWISCGTWIVFWNGLIGALIAAFLAAGVAILVVRLTNNHQTRLANEQTTEQRRQVDRGRRIEALADTAAGISELVAAPNADASGEASLKIRSAIVRWRMNGGDSANAEQLESSIKRMEKVSHTIVREGWKSDHERSRFDEFTAVLDDIKSLLYLTADWEDPDKRNETLAKMAALDKAVNQAESQ